MEALVILEVVELRPLLRRHSSLRLGNKFLNPSNEAVLFIGLEPVKIAPVPTKPLPILVGGHAAPALRRAVTRGGTPG